ncbi:hypothetical protein BFV94_2553 [Alteromonas macleodii]|uniref:Uncharacterized protein n=1 Tax=Alteromonas macleodii TaxID=28108 RepID=A0AB36FR71_ALTMA|nr:hypothetical protein BFV93_2545 [Alteromonas macleodii]OES31421.1 hypothetical protein BFV95_2553 [Alteromonas macleodii]OES31713.1 hypothetical protein BFV94_2553 [Alteromonas macleodii]OES40993.1 hypothetical protein BFV96_2539 [Alteromonas macleodii]
MPSSVFTTRDVWADFLANQYGRKYWLLFLFLSHLETINNQASVLQSF